MFLSPGSRSGRKRTVGASAPLALNFGTITSNPGEPTPGMGLSVYGTWNNAAVTFDAPLLVNVTNTASAAASSIIDFQVGGSSIMTAGPNQGSGNSGIGIRFIANTFPQVFSPASQGNNTLEFGDTGSFRFSLMNNGPDSLGGISLANSGVLGWTSGSAVNHIDTAFYREGAAGLLGFANVVNKTNAVTFRVYNTTDTIGNSNPTNYERGVFDWTTNANTLTIGTQAGGTGTARKVLIFSAASATFIGGTTGTYTAINPNPIVASGSYSFNGDGNFSTFNPSAADLSLSRLAPAVLSINNGANSSAPSGWMQWGGQQRVTSDFSRSNSTTATAITGVSSILVAQSGSSLRNYKFEAWLATAGSTAGGISIAITCTSTTITALSVDGFILDSNVVRGQQGVITSTTTPVVNSSAITSSAPTVRLSGLLRGVSSGTFGLSLAQSTANATAVIVSSGSWLEVFDVP